MNVNTKPGTGATHTGNKIISLTNSVLYFLENAFIICLEKSYRLVVIENRRIITDKGYKTEKGAKIAFLKYHEYKSFDENRKPMWSHCYRPDSKWLGHQLNYPRTPDCHL